MPKNKKPVPRKSSMAPAEDNDVLAQALADLALDLADRELGDDDAEADPQAAAGNVGARGKAATPPANAAPPPTPEDLERLVRNALRKKNDEVLYGAIERARYTDVGAYQLLRERIEEAAATVTLRRDGAPAMETNAFAVPVFVHSTGGLKETEQFQDGAAFDALVASIQAAGLEGPQAKVVLIAHAYDLDEIDRITYSHLNEMVRDATASMTDKKLVATPALERSIVGWQAGSFSAHDKAVELRFLLGFSLKRADDPFYQVPSDEAAADAYFEARMARYRQWTEQAAPLVKQVLAADPAGLELHFLYQDLVFGAKEQALAELAMLQMMSDINGALETSGQAPDSVRAVAGPADVNTEMVLRVAIYGADDELLVASEKPLDLAADLQTEVDDICDALATLGIADVSVALRFGADGVPVETSRYEISPDAQ